MLSKLHTAELSSGFEALQQRFKKTNPRAQNLAVLREYKRFLVVKMFSGDAQGGVVSPPPLIDEMWHHHILDTKHYSLVCGSLGAFLHHNPDGVDDSEQMRDTRRAMTEIAYESLFGEKPDEDIWDLVEPGRMILFVWSVPALSRTMLEVVPNATVFDVKVALSHVHGTDVGMQTLYANGRAIPLNDAKRLSDYRIRSGTELKLEINRSPVDQSDSGWIRLNVKNITGRIVVINVPADGVALDVKEAYYQKEGVDVEQQRLIWKGRQLEDDGKLSRYGVASGDEMVMVLRLIGC